MLNAESLDTVERERERESIYLQNVEFDYSTSVYEIVKLYSIKIYKKIKINILKIKKSSMKNAWLLKC